VHVVVGVADDLRLDERVGRQLAALGVREELVGREEVRRKPVAQPRGVDQPGQRVARGRVAVDPPGQPVRVEPVEQRLGAVVHREVRVGGVDDQAAGGRGVKERAVGERLRRHLREPVIEGRKAASERREHRHLLGRVAGHDLAVLVIGRLAAHLRGERGDVVGHEPIHRRHLVGVGRRVEGRDHLLGRHAAVARRIDLAEQLRVDVRELLARIGIRGVHVLRDAVGHDAAVRAVLSPLRDRVAQLLADHALEGLDLARLIQPAEEVVERAVLEHHHDHVVKAVLTLRCGHSRSPFIAARTSTPVPIPNSNRCARGCHRPVG
jgi:hypothetical protein